MDFLDAVLEVMEPEYMRWYQGREAEDAMAEFYESSRIPGCLGMVDGTHIAISAPRHTTHPQAFVSGRKSYHSINTQFILGGGGRILSLWANWPGSSHDSYIWNRCNMRKDLIANRGLGFMIADTGARFYKK